MSKGNCDLGNKESCLIFPESLDFNKMPEQLPSLDELHNEVYAEIILEHILHVHDKWVVNRVQDILLKLDVFKLLIINNYIFPDTFHCEYLFIMDVLNEINFTKGAFANHFKDLKVL